MVTILKKSTVFLVVAFVAVFILSSEIALRHRRVAPASSSVPPPRKQPVETKVLPRDGSVVFSVSGGGTIELNAARCTSGSVRLVNETVAVIGDVESSCADVRTVGSRHVLINASADPRPHHWFIGHSGIAIRDTGSDGGVPGRLVSFDRNVLTVSAEFGQGAETLVTLDAPGPPIVEFSLVFPSVPTASTVSVLRTAGAVLVDGSIAELQIGELSQIRGVVGLAGTARVVLGQARDRLALAQHFSLDSSCLSEGSSQPATPSPWMTEQMRTRGLVDGKACMMLYLAGVGSSLNITTGDASDSFHAMRAALPVEVDLGAGSDNFSWVWPEADAPVVLRLGDGTDSLVVDGTGLFNVDLGDDNLPDTVEVRYQGARPSIRSSTIFPTGPFPDSVLQIGNWRPEDRVTLNERTTGAVVACNKTASSSAPNQVFCPNVFVVLMICLFSRGSQ